MKPVLAWVKANVVSVVLLAVTLVALPTMLIIGSSMSRALRAEVQADLGRQMREVSGATVEYAVEPIIPGAPAYSTRMPPNEATTNALKALLERTAEEAAAVRAMVVEFNRRDKRVLLEGLFPEPESAIARPERLDAMVRVWAGAHAALLERYGAGSPPSQADAMRQLREIAFRVEQDMTGGRPDVTLNEEQVAAMRERMTQERINLYTSRASRLRFYANPGVFAGVTAWTETTPPPLETVWEWQWRYWVQEDIVRAVANANEGASSLLDGPIKRIERVEVDPVSFAAGGGSAGDATAEVRRDFTRSLTGRGGWPTAPNPVYDVRYATVTLLVDSAMAPRVFDAFAATNLMSIIDVDIVRVEDLREHLRAGYVYTRSPASIVRMTLRVETLWLRDWTMELAPPEVRRALTGGGGMGEAGDPTGGAPRRSPARAPARAPRAGPTRGGDGPDGYDSDSGEEW